MVTADPLLTTTTVLGLTAATSVDQLVLVAGQVDVWTGRVPSDSTSLTKTTATSDFARAADRLVMQVLPGVCQPRLTSPPPPPW